MNTDRTALAWLRLAHTFPADLASIAALRTLEPDLAQLGSRLVQLLDGHDLAFAGLADGDTSGVLSGRFLRQLRHPRGHEAAQRAIAWSREKPLRHLLTPADALYPDCLGCLPDAPPMLAVMGQLEALDLPGVSMVGSRHASREGLATTRRFARELATLGFSIVSGLAIGVDAAAHRGALDADGVTLAVSATGPDRIYPAAHRSLARDIIRRGAVLTEYPLGEGVHRKRFPERNRLVAALGYGVVVIEAGRRSGTLTTARHATDLGKPVMPVPGNVTNPCNAGSHDLIRDGATLVENTADITAAIAPVLAQELGSHRPDAVVSTGAPLDADASRALTCLDADGMALDALCNACELPPGKVLAAVSRLEIAGLLERLPGGRYARCLR